MKYFVYLNCLLCLLLFNRAYGQTHIYERYAPYDNLEVSYLKNAPLDSANAINVTIIIAHDTTSWQWLLDTFHLPSRSQMRKSQFNQQVERRDSQNPEHREHGGIMDCCLLWADYSKSTILICHYATYEQYKSIFQYISNQLINEENKN